jgi:hypothetical protein
MSTSSFINNNTGYTLVLGFPGGSARIPQNTTTEVSSDGSLQTVDVIYTNGITLGISVSSMSETEQEMIKLGNNTAIVILKSGADSWVFTNGGGPGGDSGHSVSYGPAGSRLATVGDSGKGIFENNSTSLNIKLYDQSSNFVVDLSVNVRTVLEDVTGSDFFTARYIGKPWTIMCGQTLFELPLAPESQTSQHKFASVPSCDITVDVSRDADGAAVYTFTSPQRSLASVAPRANYSYGPAPRANYSYGPAPG